MTNRTGWLLLGGAGCALLSCLVATVVAAALWSFAAKKPPAPPAPPPGADPSTRMGAFFAENKRTERPLAAEDLKKLAGTWEARYVSFELDQVPVDASRLPALALAIQPAKDGVRIETNGVTRDLVVEGARLRASGDARAELALRIAGDELVGEISQRSGDSTLHAEFRARRR